MARLAMKASGALLPRAASLADAPRSCDHDGGDPVSARIAAISQCDAFARWVIESRKPPEPQVHAVVKVVRRLPVDGDGRDPGRDKNNSGPKQHGADCRVGRTRCQIGGHGLDRGGRRARLPPSLSNAIGPAPGGKPMDFDYSPKQKEWMKRVGDFMDAAHLSGRRRPTPRRWTRRAPRAIPGSSCRSSRS